MTILKMIRWLVLGIVALPFMVLYVGWLAYHETVRRAGRCPWCWSADTETGLFTQKCESCDSEVRL